MRLAIPSKLPGGLEAPVDHHFGHCETFTIITLEGGRVAEVAVVSNGDHGPGGCGAPVARLGEAGVGALIVGGMGRRPLEIAMAAGMKVFISRAATVSDAVDAFLGGGLVEFGSEMACRGTSHGGCGGH